MNAEGIICDTQECLTVLFEAGQEPENYDPCMTNKMINGQQMTVTWHVDNLKMSHKSALEIIKFIVYIEKLYGIKIMFMIIWGWILTTQRRETK